MKRTLPNNQLSYGAQVALIAGGAILGILTTVGIAVQIKFGSLISLLLNR